MSKEAQEENVFEGFSLLAGETPVKPTDKKSADKAEIEVNELTEQEIADKKSADLLEAAAKEAEEFKKKKDVKKVDKADSEESEEESEEETEQEEEVEEGSLKPFVAHMAERGLLDFSEEDEFDDTEEGLEKIVNKTVENKVNSWKQSYPEEAQHFLEFIENGGKPSDFHKYYYQDTSFESLKLKEDDESTLKHVIREGLIAAGWEDEAEIADEISLYEDAGKLYTKAEAHLKRLQKLEGESKSSLLEAQKKYAEEQRAVKEQEWNEFQKGLFEKDQIAGFKFNPKMKQELWDYMTKPLDKKTGLTQYQKDSKEKGAEARYIFAYLMKNNWNTEKLEKDLKNKVVSGVKKTLSKYSDTRKKITSGTPTKEDQINDSDKFAGFKTYLKS